MSPNIWIAKPASLTVLAYINTQTNLPDYSARVDSIEGARSKSLRGVWTSFVLDHGDHVFHVSLYRKRLLIRHLWPRKQHSMTLADLKTATRTLVPLLTNVAALLAVHLCQTDMYELRTYPVLMCDQFRLKPNDASAQMEGDIWIDDGLSSFYVRIYDSSHLRLGYVRVSRHYAMCFGLSARLQQDVANLLYEKFLYVSPPRTAAHVFQFFDALSQYVLPLELNLYLQKIFYRLAVFGIVAGLAFRMVDRIEAIAHAQATLGATYTLAVPFTSLRFGHITSGQMHELLFVAAEHVLLAALLLGGWRLLRWVYVRSHLS